MNEPHQFVGAWRVNVSIPGVGVELVNLASFAADGTVIVALPGPNPAPAGAGHRLEYWTPALGSWVAAGPTSAEMSFVTLGTDETGVSIGSHVVSATVEIDANGASWHGPFVIDLITPHGVSSGSVAGTVTASRIPAMPSPAAIRKASG